MCTVYHPLLNPGTIQILHPLITTAQLAGKVVCTVCHPLLNPGTIQILHPLITTAQLAGKVVCTVCHPLLNPGTIQILHPLNTTVQLAGKVVCTMYHPLLNPGTIHLKHTQHVTSGNIVIVTSLLNVPCFSLVICGQWDTAQQEILHPTCCIIIYGQGIVPSLLWTPLSMRHNDLSSTCTCMVRDCPLIAVDTTLKQHVLLLQLPILPRLL